MEKFREGQRMELPMKYQIGKILYALPPGAYGDDSKYEIIDIRPGRNIYPPGNTYVVKSIKTGNEIDNVQEYEVCAYGRWSDVQRFMVSQYADYVGMKISATTEIKGMKPGDTFSLESPLEAAKVLEVPAWKQSKNFMKPNELVCFPKLKLGDRVFNYSTQMAGLIARTDNDGSMGDGTPCESSSNKNVRSRGGRVAGGKQMEKFNRMPQNAVEIEPKLEYVELQDFFTYTLKKESRAVLYDEEDLKAGLADVRIWWVNEEVGLGFALKRDWKTEKVRWYKLGTQEEWLKFKRGFAAAFRGDNS